MAAYKTNFSAEEMRAIDRYKIENNVSLMLSYYPIVSFRDRRTGKEIKKNISDLLRNHIIKKEEEKKAALSEKRRVENENKWKPRIG